MSHYPRRRLSKWPRRSIKRICHSDKHPTKAVQYDVYCPLCRWIDKQTRLPEQDGLLTRPPD